MADSTPLPAARDQLNAASQSGPSSTSPPLSTTALTPQPHGRTLRSRPSDTGKASFVPLSSPRPPPADTRRTRNSGRVISVDEIDKAKQKLSEETVRARREELVKRKEQELKGLIDQHDTAIREQFHLERYVSLIDGWDPVALKHDNSPVFTEWKQENHNLFNLAPPIAGPSKQRNSLPSRTTRRQAQEQSEAYAYLTPQSNGHTSAEHEPAAATVKVKGKGKEVTEAAPRFASLKEAARHAAELQSLETSKRGKAKSTRRTTLSVSEVPSVNKDEIPIVSTEVKKRGRMSLPNLPPAKKTRSSVIAAEASASPSPGPSFSPSPASPFPEPSPTPAPVLPSLSHLPFPPAPFRPKERRVGKSVIVYTDPSQKPSTPPRFGGNIEAMLDSYILLEDTGPSPDLKALELRAARQGYLRNRVNYLQHQGRLLRLLEENEEEVVLTKGGPTALAKKHQVTGPPRKTDHHDSLMAHMIQVRNAMVGEAKFKPQACKKIAKMIQQHWELELGREERERQALLREQKRKAKDLARAVKKRWALAVKIVRARKVAAQKLEQDRLGKEHLQNILQRSTGLLEAQRVDILGREPENQEDGESDGTEDVSAAEDDDEEVDGYQDLEDTDDEKVVGEDGVDDDVDETVDDDEGGDGDEDDEEDEESEEEDDDDADDTDNAPVDLRVLLGDSADLNEMEVDDDTDVAPSSALEVSDIAEIRPLESLEDQPPVSLTVLDSKTLLEMPELVENDAVVDVRVEDELMKGKSNGQHDKVEDSNMTDAVVSAVDVDLREVVVEDVTTDDKVAIDVTHAMGKVHVDAPGVETVAADAEQAAEDPSETHGPKSRSKRRRRSLTVDISKTSEPDPDAEDAEFDQVTSDLDEQDALLDAEMEDAEGEAGNDDDSEDAGLLADADIPIEELLKRYGYPVPDENASNDIQNVAKGQVKREQQSVDQSLTDAALATRSTSPALIIEGKRQRRARAIWTPEENLPQHAKGSKPKIEEIEKSTPEFTTDEEDEENEEDEEEEDNEEGMKNDNVKLRPPFLLRGTLRPYQQAGLEWLASLYANNMNGILADEMGLGKTIQTISLLAHLACDLGVWGQHLIIVPTSVILNWEMEFKKFLPGFKVLTYYGNQKERKEKRIGWHTENAWQVCITSYQIVLADQHIFRRKNWVYMILDEAHNIKNFRSQRWQTLLGFKAQRRLLLTGTPLQNNLMELWSLLYFLMPNGVTADATAVVGFANHKEFTEWFSNPMDKAVESGETMDEETLETVSKLHTLLRPFILRRLKSEVETQLPGKFEHVVYCRLSKRQRFLYDEFMSRASTREALTSGGYLGVVNTLMQLRKVCNHPDLFEVRPVRTSFAMERSVVADFEPVDFLIRKRLLESREKDGRWEWGCVDGRKEIGDVGLLITARENESGWVAASRGKLDATDKLPYSIKSKNRPPPPRDTRTIEGWLKFKTHLDRQETIARWKSTAQANQIRCQQGPIYGSTTLALLSDVRRLLPLDVEHRKVDLMGGHESPASSLIVSMNDRLRRMAPLINQYAVIPPKALARDLPSFALPGLTPTSHPDLTDLSFDILHPIAVKLQIAFPDASLLQYDCGKLQKLDEMLRDLKANGHRVLIFTQMTRVLDILEMFLSYKGHRYLRLDGSTKIEDRQVITERFNSDSRIFCFIASSRSGGVGINLTGADTVFFYDSDWNPSMDRQCMDRAHRIGQTREVHIYRFVSMHTVEENMLKKANQKRLLDRVVIQEGDFTTEFFGKMNWRDMLDDDIKALAEEASGGVGSDEDRIEDVDVEGTPVAIDTTTSAPRLGQERELARALAQVEDEEDAAAARVAQGEGEMDFAEFGGEEGGTGKRPQQQGNDFVINGQTTKSGNGKRKSFHPESSGTPMVVDGEGDTENGRVGEAHHDEEEEDYDEDEPGAVDEYMLKWVEWDWDWFVSY